MPPSNVHTESFPGEASKDLFSHKYLIKRPAITRHPGCENTSIQLNASKARSNGAQVIEQEAALAHPITSKRRLELFIDLIWVGIIGNLAENFAEGAYDEKSEIPLGHATGNFIILFLIAWRLWKILQDFMSKYATNDLIERVFVFWYLILALMYGNNAPFLFEPEDQDQSDVALAVYLVAKGSLIGLETIYALFISSLRRQVFLRLAVAILLSGPWIAAFFVRYPAKAGLVFTGVILDYFVDIIFNSPWMIGVLHEERSKVEGTDHWIERLRDFFAIILGEGVLNLIRGSPLGHGLNYYFGSGLVGLGIYYYLSVLHFSGDLSRTSVHATKRSWWRRSIWHLQVLPLYPIILLAVCSLALSSEISLTRTSWCTQCLRGNVSHDPYFRRQHNVHSGASRHQCHQPEKRK